MGNKRSHRRSKINARRAVVNKSNAAPLKAKGSATGGRMASLLQPLRTLVRSFTTKKRRTVQKRIVWSTLPSRFVRAGKTSLIVLLVVVVTTVLFSDVFKKNTVIIEPFLVNSELQSKGYDGPVIATAITHNISVMIQESNSIKGDKGF